MFETADIALMSVWCLSKLKKKHRGLRNNHVANVTLASSFENDKQQPVVSLTRT